jgi:hypothetical protein
VSTRALAVALRRHGLSRQGVDGVIRLAAVVRVLSERRAAEVAAMVDAATGEQLGAIVLGHEDGVSIWPHLLAMMPGRAYVQIHTHLTSPTWSFSLDDAAIFATYNGVYSMVVIGVDGTGFALSRAAAGQDVSAAALDRAWRLAALALLPSYRARLQVGDVSRVEAESALRDRVWRMVARQFGLRYARVRASGG